MILIREVMERVRGMEGKVGKQVDRLVKGAVEGGQTKEALENGESRRSSLLAVLARPRQTRS